MLVIIFLGGGSSEISRSPPRKTRINVQNLKEYQNLE